MGAENELARREVMQAHADEITPEFLQMLSTLVSQLEQQGQQELSQRLQEAYRDALRFSMEANLKKIKKKNGVYKKTALSAVFCIHHLLGFRVIQPQAMPANRDYQDVGWINQRQTVTQAADKGVEGLFRNPNSFFLSPDIID